MIGLDDLLCQGEVLTDEQVEIRINLQHCVFSSKNDDSAVYAGCQALFSKKFIIPKKRGAVPAAPSSLGFCIPKVNAFFLTKSIVAQFRLYFQRREVEDLGLTGFRGRAGGGATELFPLLLPVPPHDTPTPAGTASSGTSVEVDIPTAHRICGVVLSCRNDTDCGANERAMFAEAVAIVA